MRNVVTVSFCDDYLEKLVDYIEHNKLVKNNDYSRLAIVFGGKRPALFMKREIARRVSKSFLPPVFFTIDDFVEYCVRKKEPFTIAKDLEQAYEIYKLAKKFTPDIEILKKRGSFAQFISWSVEILKFIDQLDLEDVRQEDLENVQHNAQIGYAVPQDINTLLKQIVKIREQYHKQLKQTAIYSRGFQYLKASQLVDQIEFQEFDTVLFCNFFYFHRTEEKIIKNLNTRGKAHLIFQGDERKWPVLKRISNSLNVPLREAEDVPVPQFKLHLASGFDVHAQAGLIRGILKNIKNLNNTVIVVPNPDHVVPLLTEITQSLGDFNVSMGYPLKRSSLYSLFDFIFQAQLSKKDGRYYARDYLRLLRHPFIKNLKLISEPTATRILIHKIEEILTGKERSDISGQAFIGLDEIEACDDIFRLSSEMVGRLELNISRKELKVVLEGIHGFIFKNWEGIKDFQTLAGVLEKTMDLMVHKSFISNFPFNMNIVEKIYALIEDFQSASFKKEIFSIEEVFKIFDSHLGKEMVAFQGSPLKGLQVLGLFETRSLNFENVIVLDVNEGVLPQLKIYEPLIPREVMISLNLDRLELEEEIQRYQFMRLISSAKNVHLIYQQSKDKEPSRFVEELLWEEEKKKKQVGVILPLQGSFEIKVEQRVKSAKKTPVMVEFLKKFKYSASSINMYLRNPMEFYYSYVLGLKEQEDLLDEPEARQVGSFVHKILDESFRPFVGRKPLIDEAFQRKFFERFEEQFDQILGRAMKSDAFLLKAVLRERMVRFLENEAANEDRQIEKLIYLEQKFIDRIPLGLGDVTFEYRIDRIDQFSDGTIMILDYKTGITHPMPKNFEQLSVMDLSREVIRDEIVSFQLPLYFYYLCKQYPGQKINAALYNLRTLQMDKFISSRNSWEADEINKVFLRALDYIVSEIVDPDVDFIDDPIKSY